MCSDCSYCGFLRERVRLRELAILNDPPRPEPSLTTAVRRVIPVLISKAEERGVNYSPTVTWSMPVFDNFRKTDQFGEVTAPAVPSRARTLENWLNTGEMEKAKSVESRPNLPWQLPF